LDFIDWDAWKTLVITNKASLVFSRKRCDDNINMLSSMDLNTQVEKSEVQEFIQKSIMTLSKEDRHIPQVIIINLID
jgi:superfamily II RNA helicase